MIGFRPHHFLCTLGFMGKGYSPEFVANYQEIADTLKQNPDTPIHVIEGQDAICEACPKRIDASVCSSQPIIDILDAGYKELLGVSEGDVLTWKEAQIRVQNQVSMADFHRICTVCSWYKAGICERALVKLQSTIL